MRVAVVGAGNWGKNLVRTFYKLGVLAAVVETDASIRRDLTRVYTEIEIYKDFDEIIAGDIPAVAIATPAHTHYKLAMEALQAGKDVFVEKPLTMSSVEAEELTKMANEKDLILMVGHLLLYQPAIQRIKAHIDDGAIGSLYSLHQERLKLGRVRSVENVLWSFGVHDIAVLLYLVGQRPEKVQVAGQAVLQEDIEDDVFLHMDFPEAIQAHLHTSWLWPEQRRQLTIVGSKGMLVYNELDQTVTLHRKSVNSQLANCDEGSEVIFQGHGEPLTLECLHFFDSIKTRKRPLSSGESAIEVIRVLEQATQLLKGAKK